MKRLTLFALSAGLLLVGAAPPHRWHHHRHPRLAYAPIVDGYPACSATIADRCIQLYERGVATPRNLALNERLGPYAGSRLAMGGPYEPSDQGDADAYPPCSATVTDRCIELPHRRRH